MNNIPDKMKPGIYKTIYGNDAEYDEGLEAYDLDTMRTIPSYLVDFDKFLQSLD